MSEALTGGYSSLAEAAGEYTPAVGWVPGVDFDPDDPEDMRAVELAWDREQAARVAELERENDDLRARVAELEGGDD